MESEFVAVLLEAGPLGIFAMYLIWQRQKDAQRMDSTIARLTQRQEKEEALLRERFDVVVDKYDRERDVLMRDVSAKLDRILGQQPRPIPPPPSATIGRSATESLIERAVTKALKGDDE